MVFNPIAGADEALGLIFFLFFRIINYPFLLMLIMVIYMYTAPGWGHMSPWVQLFSESLNIQSYCPFPARLSL